MRQQHQTQLDGSMSGVQQGIDSVRELQSRGLIGDYGFVTIQGNTDGALVYFGDVVPHVHLCFIIVPRDQPAQFHYGLDSMLHIDWPEYIKLFKSQAVG